MLNKRGFNQSVKTSPGDRLRKNKSDKYFRLRNYLDNQR